MRGGRESNLIPLFVPLELRLPLSGAGSKVVTPGRRGWIGWGAVMVWSFLTENLRAWSSALNSGGIHPGGGYTRNSKALSPPPPYPATPAGLSA